MNRVEWVGVEVTDLAWLAPGEEAPDGQVAQGGGLLIGAQVIEGGPDPLLELLDRAASLVDAGRRGGSGDVTVRADPRVTFAGATDPAYEHEFGQLGELCRSFLRNRRQGSFAGQLLVTGMLTAQCAVVYKLSPPAGLLDPAELFRRETPEGSPMARMSKAIRTVLDESASGGGLGEIPDGPLAEFAAIVSAFAGDLTAEAKRRGLTEEG